MTPETEKKTMEEVIAHQKSMNATMDKLSPIMDEIIDINNKGNSMNMFDLNTLLNKLPWAEKYIEDLLKEGELVSKILADDNFESCAEYRELFSDVMSRIRDKKEYLLNIKNKPVSQMFSMF